MLHLPSRGDRTRERFAAERWALALRAHGGRDALRVELHGLDEVSPVSGLALHVVAR